MNKNKCFECVPCLEATCVEIVGSNMQIDVRPLQAYTNYQRYDLKICTALPQNTGIEPLLINDGVGNYPLIDTNGQPVVASRICGHTKYSIRFGAGGQLAVGTMPPHFTVCGDLLPVKYSSNSAYQGV